MTPARPRSCRPGIGRSGSTGSSTSPLTRKRCKNRRERRALVYRARQPQVVPQLSCRRDLVETLRDYKDDWQKKLHDIAEEQRAALAKMREKDKDPDDAKRLQPAKAEANSGAAGHVSSLNATRLTQRFNYRLAPIACALLWLSMQSSCRADGRVYAREQVSVCRVLAHIPGIYAVYARHDAKRAPARLISF